MATVDILKHGGVNKIKYVGILAAPEGIERLHGAHPDVPIHIAAIDQCLMNTDIFCPVWATPATGSSGRKSLERLRYIVDLIAD